jgi:hypothetical protein
LERFVGEVILNSGHLELKGKVLGNLCVRKGTCRVLGIVRSNLENKKGDVEVILAPAPLAIEEMGPSVKPISNISTFLSLSILASSPVVVLLPANSVTLTATPCFENRFS